MSNSVENIKADFVRISSGFNTEITGKLYLNKINVNEKIETPSLPPQVGQDGNYLRTNGSTASWQSITLPLTVGLGPTINTNTATRIATEPISITSIEYTLSLKQGSNVRTSKIFTQSDGTNVNFNEFGVSTLGTFTSPGITVVPNLQQQSFELRLEISDAATTPVQVRFSRVYI